MKLLRAIRDNRHIRFLITTGLILAAIGLSGKGYSFFLVGAISLLAGASYQRRLPEPSTFIAAERVTLVLGHIDLSSWSDPIELNKGNRVLVCVDFEYNDGRMCKCYLTPRSGRPISVKADRAEGADNDA